MQLPLTLCIFVSYLDILLDFTAYFSKYIQNILSENMNLNM